MHFLLQTMEQMLEPGFGLSESRGEYLWWEALHKLEYAYRRFDTLRSKYLQPVVEELEARLDITMEELIAVYCKWFGTHWGDEQSWQEWVDEGDIDVWHVVGAYVESVRGILESGAPSIVGKFVEYEEDYDGEEETGIIWYNDPDVPLDEPVNISEACQRNPHHGEDKLSPREIAIILAVIDGNSEDEERIKQKTGNSSRSLHLYVTEDIAEYLRNEFENMFSTPLEAAEYLFSDQGFETFKMLLELQGQDKKNLSDRLVLMTKALNVAHHGGFMAQYAHITNQELRDLNYIKVTPPSEVALYRVGGEEAWLYRMIASLLGQYADPEVSRASGPGEVRY